MNLAALILRGASVLLLKLREPLDKYAACGLFAYMCDLQIDSSCDMLQGN